MCSMPAPPGAAILHADLDAFYASVEQRDRPELKGRPIVVGGGVVLAASYEARACGIRTAMNGATARSLCPGLIEVPPRMEAYSAASREVFAIFNDTTPLVEPISIDEAFLDVGGLGRLAGPPAEIASNLRHRVADQVGLPISVGVARTKFLAKVASGEAKPDGLLVVDPDAEADFLHPLPVRRLWGVGPATADRLARVGITTVADVAAAPESTLVGALGGGPGRHLHALAHNQDPRRVVTGRRRSSLGAQRALGQRPKTLAEVDAVLLELVDRVTTRLRGQSRVGRTVTVRFRFGDLQRDARSTTFTHATDSTTTVLRAGRRLVRARHSEIAHRRLTLLGLTISGLSPADAIQQAFDFGGAPEATHALDRTLDEVRDRYGSASIGRARLTGRAPGLSVPVLPDPAA